MGLEETHSKEGLEVLSVTQDTLLPSMVRCTVSPGTDHQLKKGQLGFNPAPQAYRVTPALQ